MFTPPKRPSQHQRATLAQLFDGFSVAEVAAAAGLTPDEVVAALPAGDDTVMTALFNRAVRDGDEEMMVQLQLSRLDADRGSLAYSLHWLALHLTGPVSEEAGRRLLDAAAWRAVLEARREATTPAAMKDDGTLIWTAAILPPAVGVSGCDFSAAADRHPIGARFLRSHAGARRAASSAKVRPMAKKTEVNGANGADTQLRRAAEHVYANELEALAREDDRARSAGWRLSPRAVVTYLMGGKTRSGVEITPKYIGNRRLIETAVATLATDRALLLLGVPGTAKSWVSEHLAAAITGSSSLLVQCTAGTDENQIPNAVLREQTTRPGHGLGRVAMSPRRP